MSKTADGCKNNQVEEEIMKVYHNICQAFELMDLDSALSYFSDSENMVKISNGRMLRGKKQLSEYWHQLVVSGSKLLITVENVQIHKIDSNHVWATADENISLDGQQNKAVVSNIFIRTHSEWKILLDHTTYVPAG